MSKVCRACIKKGASKEEATIPLRLYAQHLKDKHSIELTHDPVDSYLFIRDQVEATYDNEHVGPAALGNDGALIRAVLGKYYRNDKGEPLAIYDTKDGSITINCSFEMYMDFVQPLMESITRAGRDLREEAREHPEQHPNWKISEHVRLYRKGKELGYHSLFANRKKLQS